MIVNRKHSVWWLPLAFCLTACSGIVAPDQTASDLAPAILRPGESIGQTFVARQLGFTGVEIFLAPNGSASGELRLSLRPEAGSSVELAAATLPVSAITAPNFYRFNFAPQRDSRQRYYSIQLELAGGGEVAVGQGAADSYLDGALYQNGQPVEAQMMFRLVYDTPLGLLGLGLMLIEWLALSLAGLVLFVLPGWAALTRWWPKDAPLAWPEKFGLAAGLSVALYPVLMLWTHLIGLQLGALYAWLPAVLGTAAVIWQAGHVRLGWLSNAFTRWQRSDTVWADVTLLLVVALTFAVRFWLIRSQEAPMWGDSVHHTMIAQLLLDNGGLFNSWLPYAELSTFTYHFGFHSAVAAFAWLTGLDVLQSVMWVGQILNGLAVLALWPLVLRVSGNRWAAVAVVVVAGLLSPMPNYYVNWGRYTQLAGQVILPAAMVLAWWIIERRSSVPKPIWVLAALVWAGLALTHYRVLIFGVVFVALLAGADVLSGRWRTALMRTSLLGLCAFVLFLPWFVRVFGGRLILILGAQIMTPPLGLSDFEKQYNSLGDITFYLSPIIWVVIVAAGVVTVARQHRAGSLMLMWAAGVLLAANPQWIGLPGSGVLASSTVMMGVYMLAGVLIGGMLGWTLDWLGHHAANHRPMLQSGWALLFGIVALLGLLQRFGDYQSDLHAMVTRPDIRAAQWIHANTPTSARLLVNNFFAYGGGMIVGSDAGWWSPVLTRRLTSLPPMTYIVEQPATRPDFYQWTNDLARTVEQWGVDAPETIAALRAHGVTHVYIGQRHGAVGYEATASFLKPQDFLTSQNYRLVYRQDRVWLFVLQ